jgi:uncharacterized membrane protein YkoI
LPAKLPVTIRDRSLVDTERKEVKKAMLKKVLAGIEIAAVFTAMFLLGGIATGHIFAQSPQNPAQVQFNEQQSQYTGSIQIDNSQYEGMSDADEAVALKIQAKITAAKAEQAALAANPETTAVKTEIDNENGVLVYSVELSNGIDVKVDAGNGKVLYTEQGDNDANEVDGIENSPGQESVED